MDAMTRWLYQVRRDDPFINTENMLRRAWDEGARAERLRCVGLLHQNAEQRPEQRKTLLTVAAEVTAIRDAQSGFLF